MTGFQIELGTAVETAYQRTATNADDITEDGVESVSCARFDLVDDVLTTGAISGGLAGQAFVAGDGGCYVSDLAIAAGGSFGIGGTSHNWTGAAPGILRAVTDNTGRVLDAMIREGTYTEDEIARLERYYRALGGKGLLVPVGMNLVVNGAPDTDTAGWTGDTSGNTTFDVVSGRFRLQSNTETDYTAFAEQVVAVEPGATYLAQAQVENVGAYYARILCSGALGISSNGRTYDSGVYEDATVVRATGTTLTFRFYAFATQTGQAAFFDNLSLRRLIPREDL